MTWSRDLSETTHARGQDDAAEAERLANRVALLHGALLRIAALDPSDAHEAPAMARQALERRPLRD